MFIHPKMEKAIGYAFPMQGLLGIGLLATWQGRQGHPPSLPELDFSHCLVFESILILDMLDKAIVQGLANPLGKRD